MMQFIFGRALQGLGNIVVNECYNINTDHIVSLRKESKIEKGTKVIANYTLYIATVKFADGDVDFLIDESNYNKLLYMER